jgi:hypothetical protein
MTNKELFKKLTAKQQMEMVKHLACYNKAHIEFYNGEYHITSAYCLLAKYPEDYKVLNEFESKEFYPNGVNYELEWFYFWNDKEKKGEKNEIIDLPDGSFTGKWQQEFEDLFEPRYQKALRYFLGE